MDFLVFGLYDEERLDRKMYTIARLKIILEKLLSSLLSQKVPQRILSFLDLMYKSGTTLQFKYFSPVEREFIDRDEFTRLSKVGPV